MYICVSMRLYVCMWFLCMCILCGVCIANSVCVGLFFACVSVCVCVCRFA